MNRRPASPILHGLLLRGASGRRMWAALGAMTLGLTLLLIAVLLWWNFDLILHGSASKDDLGSTFLTVGRRVTAENMGHPERTLFTAKEAGDFRNAPEVQDVGAVTAFRPQAYMRMELGSGPGFSTDMVLESVPDRFMDKRPVEWEWHPGSIRVPIILSSSFLSLYNYVFAPGRGLPQLSEESIKVLPFRLDVGSEPSQTYYLAQVVGFSDRITSVLVPESFVQYANGGNTDMSGTSRLIVKVKDPSSTAFAHFLESHDYVTNSELTRFSKLRGIVQSVAGITGVLALLLLGISLLLFVLFIELTIVRAQASVRLLLELGYAPSMLKRFLLGKFFPLIMGVAAMAILIACIAQLVAERVGEHSGLELPVVPGWPMWACLALVGGLLLWTLQRAVDKAIRQS